MATTRNEIDGIVARINQEFGLDLIVRKAYGQCRIERDGGAVDVSPRLPLGQLKTWLYAYLSGLTMARDSGHGLHAFTRTALMSATANTVADYDNRNAVRECQPFLVAMDALLRMAHDCSERHGHTIAEDYYARDGFIETMVGLHSINSMDFGRADNRTIESIYWEAVRVAGLTEGDVQ